MHHENRSVLARLDAIIEATTHLRLSAQARLALEEAAEAIAARVRFLGEGMEGQAYETPDDLVLKVTNNAMTAQNARKLMRKPQRNFEHVYKVEPVPVRKGKKKETQYHIYMENLSPPSKEWRAFANAIWAGALTKRPSSAAKRYLRKAGPLPPKIRWYRNVLAQAKLLRLPFLDMHEDNIMMRGRLPVVIDP